jgi:hypothetical protein
MGTLPPLQQDSSFYFKLDLKELRQPLRSYKSSQLCFAASLSQNGMIAHSIHERSRRHSVRTKA